MAWPFPGARLVNVLGSFIIGFFAAATGPDGRWPASPDLQRFVMVGILGGYTTFSAFSLQTLDLVRHGDMMRAGANVVLSVGLCLVAVWIGHALASSLSRSG